MGRIFKMGSQNGPILCNLDEEYKQTAISAINKVSEMHEGLTMMLKHTEHLDCMPKMTSAIEDLKNVIVELKDDLVIPATSKKQIPVLVHFLTIAVLGVFIVVLLMKDSSKTFQINRNGMSIGESKEP